MEIMREEKEVVAANWPSSSRRWEEEEELPSPEELMPLSQTLITPDLAIAFDIPAPTDSSNHGPGGPSSSSPTLKKPRLVWTPHLHKRFVEAVAHLGIKNAVPKTIMQLMSVDGLTRENVASHLQKYRLYLKRMQQHHHHHTSTDSTATDDRLFAMAPAPSQLMLRPPFVPVVGAMQHLQNLQYHHHNRMGVMHAVPPHLGVQRMAAMYSRPPPLPSPTVPAPPPYVEDLGSGELKGIRRVLTLFPTGKED